MYFNVVNTLLSLIYTGMYIVLYLVNVYLIKSFLYHVISDTLLKLVRDYVFGEQ